MPAFFAAVVASSLTSLSRADDCSLDAMSLLQKVDAHGHLEHSQEALQPGPAAAPAAASTSRDEVNAIWNTMRDMWPHPAMPEDDSACIQMNMRDNTMSMDGTTFTFPRSSSNMQSNLLEKGAEEGKMEPSSELLTREVNFAPLLLSKNMKGNTLTMLSSTLVMNDVPKVYDEVVLDNGTPRAPLRAQSLLQEDAANAASAAAGTSTGSNMYMYDSQLSMDATTFTMNVGTSPSLLQTDSAVVNINKLNINMYMHGNSMSMANTDFAMNVRGQPQSGVLPTDVSTAGMAGDDLARLLLLSISSFRQAASDNSLTQRPVATEELQSVWSWLSTWNGDDAADDAVDINMYMYDNQMSMDQTIFRMNVGSSGTSLSQTDARGKSNVTGGSSEDSTMNADTYLYDQQYSMQNTVLTLGTSSLLETQSKTQSEQPAQQAPADVNMYMYRNEMSMTNTHFTMNVGSNSQSLLQVEQGETVNVGSINIKMYMLENDMSMSSTVFTWTLG